MCKNIHISLIIYINIYGISGFWGKEYAFLNVYSTKGESVYSIDISSDDHTSVPSSFGRSQSLGVNLKNTISLSIPVSFVKAVAISAYP
jgi:hypothetical protein